MDDEVNDTLTDAELRAFLDAMFPNGLAGPDVMAELAQHGWEQSMLAPSASQTSDELTELVGLCLWDIFSDNHALLPEPDLKQATDKRTTESRPASRT